MKLPNEYGMIEYVPSENDLAHINEIKDFLISRNIPFEDDENRFGVLHLNDRTLQLRYVNSFEHPIDTSKKKDKDGNLFGDKCEGIPHTYFSTISHNNHDVGIRTIWIFDFEMEQKNDIVDDEGNIIKGFRRQWEVIKNTICTATGNIDKRIFARDTYVKEITNKEAQMFLNTNCFYGYRSATNTIALYLKKDKCGLKKDTLLMVYSFGHGFYANKKHLEDPTIEIIRVSTRLGCQVIGGMSKCLKHFLTEHPTMEIGGKEVEVNKLVFYVDSSHNDSRGMKASGLNFNFVSWDINGGFMNMFTEDCHEEIVRDGKKSVLSGKRGDVFHRKPLFHKEIMRLIKEGKVISVANAGTIVYEMTRKEFLGRYEDS